MINNKPEKENATGQNKSTNQGKIRTNYPTNPSEMNSLEIDAFRQSSRTPRSPTRNREINPFIQSTKTPRSPVDRESSCQGSPKSGPFRRNTSRSANSVFSQLGEQIRSLIDMLEDGKRRSIHQPMRDAIDSIRRLYEELEVNKTKEINRSNSATQTSPWMRNQQIKRRQEEMTETPESKRPAPNPVTRVLETKTIASTSGMQEKEKDENARKEPKWQKVTRKKVRKRRKGKKDDKGPQSKRTKPDAIMIAAGDSTSHADILRKVKTDPKLSELGTNVSKIRSTNKGELLFQLRTKTDQTEHFKGAIGELLGESASVRTLKERRTIEIKDIDEITSKDEVYDAIGNLPSLTGSDKPNILSLRRAYGGTQTATLSLNVDTADILLKEGRIKIGWVVCRIREKIKPTKCYRCLQFGHIARHCRSEVDRSGTCIRCGQEGHNAKNCRQEPLCMFCKADNPKSANHVAGSGKCPLFLGALKTRLRK